MDPTELKRLLLNLLRKGEVIAVDHGAGKARVQTGELTTAWIPWFAFTAGETRDWLPPTIGEQVMLLCPGGDPADAVILAGFFSDDHPAPSNLASLHTRHYPDGAVMQYDHETHVLDVTLPAGATVNIVSPQAVVVQTETARIECETFDVKTAQATIDGPLRVTGLFEFESGMNGKGGAGGGKTMQIDGAADFTGEVKSKNVSLPNHDHPETGSVTGKPR